MIARILFVTLQVSTYYQNIFKIILRSSDSFDMLEFELVKDLYFIL